jgi:hypothetical protein
MLNEEVEIDLVKVHQSEYEVAAVVVPAEKELEYRLHIDGLYREGGTGGRLGRGEELLAAEILRGSVQ